MKKIMKKLLQRITAWMVTKTNYTPQLPLPIQPIIITPEDLKKFHAQHIIPYHEWYSQRWVEPDCYIKEFKYQVINDLMNEIIIRVEETPDGIKFSCDLLLKNLNNSINV